MPISFYEVAWIFVIYAFLGWCTEVAYAALNTGSFVNRGFLNGPVCPIYGCGVLVVVVVLTPLKENFLILFAGSFLLTSVIEFITGFLLEKLFHNQWWDYSNEHFNICGYVCLKFSIMWGLACTLIMDVIHPAIYKIIHVAPKIPGTIILVILCILFVIDLIITISTILKFNEHLKLLDETGARLKDLSNEIGENIYEGVENISNLKNSLTDKKEEFTESIDNVRNSLTDKKEEKKEEWAQLQAKYREALEKHNSGEKRLMKAFPALKAKGHEESYNKLKKYFEKKS